MKYSILLLVLFLSSCNSNNKQSTIDKSENKIYKKDTLAELKDFSVAIISVNDIWSYQKQNERIIFNGEESKLQDSTKTIIKNLSNMDYSLVNDSFINEYINKFKKDISILLSSKPNDNYKQHADSLYFGIKEKIYKRYVYDELCSLNEDTFWVYIDRNRYIQNPNWNEYLAMDEEKALERLDQRIIQATNMEEKTASILTWADIYYSYYRGNGAELAIAGYQRIMEQNTYSVYLWEAWVKWRTLMQFEVYGRSRDSEIPNSFYNLMRKKCLDIIYQYIKNNPNDQVAINQYYTMADYDNLKRNGNALMGNDSWLEVMKFFPYEEK